MDKRLQKDHLIVFLAFSEVDIIKKSFDSVHNEKFDYFIVENKSENSDKIRDYFLQKKQSHSNLVGYIQFVENISATALDCFLEDFDSLIKKYKYLTITDGDFFVYDINDAMEELRKAFHDPRCFVSSIGLYMKNNYTNNSSRLIGTEHYITDQSARARRTPHSYQVQMTSNCFVTFKTDNLEFLKKIHYIDTKIYSTVGQLGGLWFKCLKNQAYHLTWDLYVDGNPYYEWKKNVLATIWDKKNRTDYINYFNL